MYGKIEVFQLGSQVMYQDCNPGHSPASYTVQS